MTEEKKTKKKVINATFTEKLQIKEILDQRLHSIEGTDMFRYEEGWSDLRVGQEVNKRLTDAPAAYIRSECFGKLKRASYGTSNKAHELRVTALEHQLRRLMDILSVNADERATVLGNVETNGEGKDNG